MSFAGHVFDMIRRNKDDREALRQLRKRTMDGRTNLPSRIPDISVEEFDHIKEQTKEREQQEKRYLFRTIFLVLGTGVAILFVCWIVKLVVFLLFKKTIL